MTQIELTSELKADLIDHMGTELNIVNSARVSFNEASEELTPKDEGLIKFLLKNRHACYDSETDVLTSTGWKNWEEVTGDEVFITLNLQTDEIELQHAERIVHEPYSGPMVKMDMAHVDALVTPNHRIVAAPRTSSGKTVFGLHEASEFFNHSYRLRMGEGEWDGEIHDPETAALVGFIVADGHVSKTSISFSLVKQRKIEFLTARATVSVSPHSISNAKTYRILGASEHLKLWAKQTYTESGERCFPRELLERGDQETLQALLDGYLAGDGSVSATGKITASTVSRPLVDDLQELALKVGISATEIQPLFTHGFKDCEPKPLFRVCFYRERNSRPKIGWTTDARREQVTFHHYEGTIHCATVPNGTLYVRRNGKPMWSGNSPFEHCVVTFRIEAPIFIAREWHRHRTQSYNEWSGRYSQLQPRFYVPNYDRPLIQKGKPGAYYFEVAQDDRINIELFRELRFSYQTAWTCYEYLLDELEVAKEVARMCLPVAVYTSWYATANLRNWINFLSLRAEEHALYEIRQLAFMVEEQLYKLYPITLETWDKAGRGSL